MDSSDIIRTPVSHTVSYEVSGLPGIPTRYSRDIFLVPTHLTIVYLSSPDPELGAVQAGVTGWWRSASGGLESDQLTTETYAGDMAEWPDWLAAEVCQHDPSGPEQTDRQEAVEAFRSLDAPTPGFVHGIDPLTRKALDLLLPETDVRDAVLRLMQAGNDTARRWSVFGR